MLRPDFTQAKNYILQHKLLSLLAICVIGITLTLGLRHLSNQSTSKKAVMKPIVHTQTVSRRPLYKSINLFGQLKAKAQIDIVNKYAGIVGSEYMPRTDESAIQVNIELPTGYNADQTNEVLLLFEDYLAKVPEIEHYMTNVTTTQSMGKLVIALKSSDERSRDVWQVTQEIRSFAKQNLGEIKVLVNEMSFTSKYNFDKHHGLE